MRAPLFLGCTVPVRAMSYELSARMVAAKLGLNLVDLDFGCCCFPLEPVDVIRATAVAVSNLALASESGYETIVTLCNACSSALTKANYRLREERMRTKVLKLVEGLGLEYREEVSVKHFIRLIYEDVGKDALKDAVESKLEGINVVAHYGCHYSRPSEVYGGFEHPEEPKMLDELIEILGAKSVDYPGRSFCCGGALSGVKEDVAYGIAREKLGMVMEAKADLIVAICPFCGLMLELGQIALGLPGKIPVLYYPELMGLTLGIPPEKLGIGLHAIDASEVLRKVVM